MDRSRFNAALRSRMREAWPKRFSNPATAIRDLFVFERQARLEALEARL